MDRNARVARIVTANAKTEEQEIAMEKSSASLVWYPCGCYMWATTKNADENMI